MSPGRTAMPGRKPGVFVAVEVDGTRFDVGYENGRPFVVRRLSSTAPGTWWRLETLEPNGPYARAAQAADAFLAQFRLPAVAL
jgi:hypothetical protein